MSLAFVPGTVAELEGEGAALMARHHAEVVFDIVREPLAVNFAALYELERLGMLSVTLARDAGRLVGYITHAIARHMHHDFLVAYNESHYLAPECRRGTAGARFLHAAEAALTGRGVTLITFNTPARHDLDKGAVFKRLGYAPLETVYAKLLET